MSCVNASNLTFGHVRLLVKLMRTNETQNDKMKKGVAQGLPLSPIIFIMCINFVLKELSEIETVNEFVFQPLPGLI